MHRLTALLVATSFVACKSKPVEPPAAPAPKVEEKEALPVELPSPAATVYRFDPVAAPREVLMLRIDALLGLGVLNPAVLRDIGASGPIWVSAGLVDERTVSYALASPTKLPPPRVSHEVSIGVANVAAAKAAFESILTKLELQWLDIDAKGLHLELDAFVPIAEAVGGPDKVHRLGPGYVIRNPEAGRVAIARFRRGRLEVRVGFPSLPKPWSAYPHAVAADLSQFDACATVAFSRWAPRVRLAQATGLLASVMPAKDGEKKRPWPLLVAGLGSIGKLHEISPQLFDGEYRCDSESGWIMSVQGYEHFKALAGGGAVTIGAATAGLPATGPLVSASAYKSWSTLAGKSGVSLLTKFFALNMLASSAVGGEIDPTTPLGAVDLAKRRLKRLN